MSALLNIAVAEPSAIIRSGLEAVLKRIPGFRIQIIENCHCGAFARDTSLTQTRHTDY